MMTRVSLNMLNFSISLAVIVSDVELVVRLTAVFSSFSLCRSHRGNITLPKIPESNMALSVLGVFLGLLLEVSTHGPSSVPRSSWKQDGE